MGTQITFEFCSESEAKILEARKPINF